MTALAADRRVTVLHPGIRGSIGAAANAVWYKGSLISRNSSGFGIVAADTASTFVVGVAREAGNNTGGANDAVEIPIDRYCIVNFAIQSTSITVADIGFNAIVQDDQTVTDATTATNDIPVGMIVDVEGSGTVAYVHVGVFGPTNAP